MSVRNEKTEDKSVIATLIARTYAADGAATIEQTSTLRSLESYNNDLALIDENEGKVKAFSLYTPVDVEKKHGSVFLAPFAIDTSDENYDVVSFLEETFKKVGSTGKRYIFVMGDLEDLSPLGFVFADSLDFSIKGNPPVSLLVKDLGDGDVLKGEVELPEALLV